MRAGDAVLRRCAWRPNFTSWLMVGISRENLAIFVAPEQTPGAGRRDYRGGALVVNAMFGPFPEGQATGVPTEVRSRRAPGRGLRAVRPAAGRAPGLRRCGR